MNHIKFGISILILIIFVGLLVNTDTLAQQDDQDLEIYAVSTLGEKLDFKQVAGEIAKKHDTQAYNDKLMLPSFPLGVTKVETIFIPDQIIIPDG